MFKVFKCHSDSILERISRSRREVPDGRGSYETAHNSGVVIYKLCIIGGIAIKMIINLCISQSAVINERKDDPHRAHLLVSFWALKPCNNSRLRRSFTPAARFSSWRLVRLLIRSLEDLRARDPSAGKILEELSCSVSNLPPPLLDVNVSHREAIRAKTLLTQTLIEF